MYNISDKFKSYVQQSHKIVYKAEVLSGNELITDQLNIVSGNVSVDSSSSTRRRARVKLVCKDGDKVPSRNDFNSLLHPLSNNEIRLYRGIKFNDGTQELVPLGVFRIFDTNIEDNVDSLSIELSLFDRARLVERARLLQNYVVPMGTNYATAIKGIIEDGVPGLLYNFPPINFVTPQLVFGSSGDLAGGDRWKYAREMASSIGHELYFNLNGIVTLRPVPNVSTGPTVWHYQEGPTSTMLYNTRRLSIENTFNTVIVRGESTTNEEPVQYTAMDEDPTSPTYVGDPPGSSPYGMVPTFLISNYVSTVEQAEEVAKARLRQVTGTTETMRVIVTVNPAHEAGDIIKLSRIRSKLSSRYVLDKFNVPLEYNGSMNFTMREGRV